MNGKSHQTEAGMPIAGRTLALRVLATALIGAGMVVVYLERARINPDAILALLANHPWAPAAYVGLHIVASLLFVPRLAMAVAAGLIFGLWWGLLLSTLGSMAGSATGFAISRYLGAGVLGSHSRPWLARLMQHIQRGGWRAVVAMRLLPIMPHTPVNYAFGLTPIGWGAYLAGTFIGFVPSTVVAVSAGATGGRALGGSDWLEPTLIGLAALLVSLALPKLMHLRRGGAE
ncbi:MAG: TVP38/TMEM64 family protein [Proteobacteria bacterium]|nr:TVP38/TMEM64 family protein [Pseudomonadota bacterium]MBI3499846.1 TVP38/TMEM64 family protein [Pseudomonadota bacterium]